MNDYTITLPRTPAVVIRAKGFATTICGALVFFDDENKDFFTLAPGQWATCCLAGKEPLPEYQGGAGR